MQARDRARGPDLCSARVPELSGKSPLPPWLPRFPDACLWDHCDHPERVPPKAVLLNQSPEAGLSSVEQGHPELPAGPGGNDRKAFYVQCPVPLSLPLGQETGVLSLLGERTLPLHCRVGVRTPPAGKKVPSASRNVTMPLRVPKPICDLVRWLLCLFSSFCQSPIFNADRRFFPVGHGVPAPPYGADSRGPYTLSCIVTGLRTSICEHTETFTGDVTFQRAH